MTLDDVKDLCLEAIRRPWYKRRNKGAAERVLRLIAVAEAAKEVSIYREDHEKLHALDVALFALWEEP